MLAAAVVASLLTGTQFAAPALAAPSAPAPAADAQESPAENSADADLVNAAKAGTIDITSETTVAADADLTVAATVYGAADEEVTLKLVGAQNRKPVAGSETTVTIGADGEAAAEVPAGQAGEGQFVLVDADELRSSKVISIESAEAQTADPEATADETAGAEETADASAAETPAAEDAPLDEYYPKAAKDMFDADGDGQYEIPGPAAGGKAHGNVPAGLDAYYSQKIEWSPEFCTDLGRGTYEDRIGRKAECGYMISPIDANDPSKGNIAIAVMKVKAGKAEFDENGRVTGFTPTKSKGSVMWNPGGPGGSGMTMSVVGALYAPDLAEHYDMVGFDPRGTGASMPYSQCSSDQQLDEDRMSNLNAQGREVAEEDLNARAERYAKDCFENTGKLFKNNTTQEDLMKHLGTWDAVGDLDMIRSVAGDDKLQYVGFSYGTQLGYVYAQKFGSNAGRLVLDGAVDPGDAEAIKALQQINARSDRYADLGVTTITAPKAAAPDDGEDFTADQEDNINQGAGFQDTFEQFALKCSAEGGKGKTWAEVWGAGVGGAQKAAEEFNCPLGNGIDDPAELSANNAKLLQTLETANGGKGLPTGQAGDERTVSFADGRQGVFQALYSESLWPQLALGLDELKQGQTAGILMMLADDYASRDPETGHYDPMLQAFTNIRCTDSNSYGDMPSLDRLRKFAEAYDKAAPFQAGSVSPGAYDYCDFWKFKGTLPKAEELTKVPNILVVSTSHDSATPYANGVKLARLINGTLLSVSGASHTSYIGGYECVDNTVNNFLVTGEVPANGDFGEELAKPDTAVDDLGNKVELPKRCKVETFRSSDFTVSTSKVHADEEVMFNVTHMDSEAKYTVNFDGREVASFTTDNGGNKSGTFTVPADAKPGDYAVTLVDANGNVVGQATITVMGADDPKTDDNDGSEDGNSQDDGNGNGDDSTAPDAPSNDNPNAQGDGNGPLPRTGADIAGLLGLALALLVGGAAATRLVRQRARR